MPKVYNVSMRNGQHGESYIAAVACYFPIVRTWGFRRVGTVVTSEKVAEGGNNKINVGTQ